MKTKNTHWVITFSPDGLKVDVSPYGTPSPVTNLPEEGSGIMLSKERGIKLNFIRVVYTLCQLGYFTNSHGGRITDIQVFRYFGRMLETDFSNYSKDLSRSLQDGNAYTKHTKVFEEMRKILRDRFDSM